MNEIISLLQSEIELTIPQQQIVEEALSQALEDGERLRWNEAHEEIAQQIEQRLRQSESRE